MTEKEIKKLKKAKVNNNGNIIKIFYPIMSIIEEKIWLENMSLEGWKLKEITLGVNYTFEKIAPTKLIYEVDRFDYSKHPSKKEITEKNNFFNMSSEMGWEIVAHDEDLNYYFCKKYEDNEVNELYSDYESRANRAEKFRNRYITNQSLMHTLGLISNITAIILGIILGGKSSFCYIFYTFVVGYNIFVLGSCKLLEKTQKNIYNDLLLTTDEWIRKNHIEKENIITKRKIFFSTKNMIKYLNKMSQEGYELLSISNTRLVFEKAEGINNRECKYYQFDTLNQINKRRKEKGLDKFSDKKDINEINIDWLSASVKEAQEIGAEYVCAISNKMAVYRSNNKSTRINQKETWYAQVMIGMLGKCVIIGGIIGFIIGFVSSIL